MNSSPRIFDVAFSELWRCNFATLVKPKPPCSLWGDVIGISLDAELQEMRFSMNGRDLGVAFVGFDMEGLFPACSMNVGQAALFNFGHSPFLYTPPTDSGGSCFRPVLEIVPHCASVERARPGFTGEGDAEAARNDDQTRGDTHELTPRGTRSSNTTVGAGHSCDERYMQGGENEDISHLEFERQGLVENLIGMGFPVEWAIRAAGRSGSVMSESAATAWIIERLEIENTKMEEEMGNMGTCEEDSAGGNSGIGDEYNDDTGESDDGDAPAAAAGFRYPSEVAGIERRSEDGAAGADGGTGDRRWHDMDNAARRSFVAQRNVESPATAGAFTPGVTTEGVWTADGLVNSSPLAAASVERGEAATFEILRHGLHGLARIALSANEGDLPSLSLVLDMALSILFARAAMTNLFMHVATPSTKSSCPSVRLAPTATTKRSGVGHGDETLVAIAVARGVLDTLADPENQQCVVDLTKALVTWSVPSWSVTFPEPSRSIEGFTDAVKGNTAVIGRNESLEGFRPGVCFGCSKAGALLGLYPGSCTLSMRSLFDLVHAAVKPRSNWKAWCSAKPASAPWSKGDPPLYNPSDLEASRNAKVPSLTRLLALFVREAISVFETDPTLVNSESTGVKASAAREHKSWNNERGKHGGMREPGALRSKCLWALWVLDTILALETGQREKGEAPSRDPDGEDASSGPVWTATEESDDTCEELAEGASAGSPNAFAAALRAATSNDLDETVRSLACSLCSVMLNLSRLVPGTSDLAQALRSKLKHAASRQQEEEGPSLVLKVRACGLWDSDSFRVAALDLSSRGCLKVNGLAADTCYSFRLERRAALPSPVVPADVSDDEDEGSFPLSAATVGVNSTGESSADQLGADTTDGASALTGIDGSGGGGGGGGSTCSEGCTTVLTDESPRQEGQASYCTSSTRAVAGRNSRPAATDRYTNKHMEFQWPSTGGRDRFCGTSADFVMGRANGAIMATMSVATPPEVPFMLDAEGCGPNLLLTNSNLTVTNTGRKKWSAVRATRGFGCGVHRWEVRIDRCVSKNVFVGVMSSESRLNNYVGSDRKGWGYLANRAIWHNKGKVRSYGDLFREGDTIGVTLNMDLGTLRFTCNGRDLGLAVQGLEGMLYPAVSMYNRNDQLTFIPREDNATPPPTPSPDVNVGETSAVGSARAGGVLYGTFSAECVVRRASKVLEVLGALDHDGGLASPAGVELVDAVRSRLFGWVRGEHGKSVPSSRTCAPVRIDTSDQARRDLFGLGARDRVLSAEGEATVLGATKHSLWVAVEATSSSSASSPGLNRDPRAWGSEVEDMQPEGESRGNGGYNSPSSSHRNRTGVRGSKIASWSRGTVRQIIGRPEEYVVSRHATRTDSVEQFGPASTNEDARDSTVADDVVDLSPDEVQNMLSRWTPSMDEALGRHLSSLADSMAVSSPLDVPFNALDNLPSTKDMFLRVSSVAPAEVRARATLLLYVNDLVAPLLPLVDTAVDNRGPLGNLVHKFRHLLFKQAKFSLLDNVIRPTSAMLSSEAGPAPAYTIPLTGVASLPRSPSLAGHANSSEIRDLSWAQTSREVDKSVFGQVARHLSHSIHVLSEGPMAFFVELVDASILDRERDKDESLALPDARADRESLYRGVFWQVCAEVFSPPIAMFVLPETGGATAAASPTAPDAFAAGIEVKDKTGESRSASHGTEIEFATKKCPVEGLVPNPFFTSNGMSPECMDPGRVALYRSFGVIVGLAVRTGVPLPLSHLSSKWWMLVSDSARSFDEPAAVRDKASELTTLRSVCPDEANSSGFSRGTSLHSSIDGVFTSLGRLAEAGLPEEEIEALLAGAKFVAPLPNGQVTELLPGGLNRPVTSQNLGEYRCLLARFRGSEFVAQASAFRAGLEDALPKRVLSLLTWREMEELVCGGSSSPANISPML
eukprot:g6932.t1